MQNSYLQFKKVHYRLCVLVVDTIWYIKINLTCHVCLVLRT